MGWRDFWRREFWVARHGQPRNFRIAKWLVILFLLGLISYFGSWQLALGTFLICCALGVCLHFFLRYKTDCWTKSWGPYKRIKLDGE